MSTRSVAAAISAMSSKSPSMISAPAMPPVNLDVGAAVMMGMIPVGSPRVIVRNGDFDFVALPRLHRAEDVVGDAARG